jgi:hypothetical protein
VPVACNDKKLTLNAGVTPQPGTKGRTAMIFLWIHNGDGRPCILTVARIIGDLKIYDLQHRLVWSSRHCPDSIEQQPSTDREVRAKSDALPQVKVPWKGHYSAPGCAAGQPEAPDGQYRAVWTVDGSQKEISVILGR